MNITAARAVDRELLYIEWENSFPPHSNNSSNSNSNNNSNNNYYYYYYHYCYLAQQQTTTTTTTTTNNSNKLDKCVEYGHDDPWQENLLSRLSTFLLHSAMLQLIPSSLIPSWLGLTCLVARKTKIQCIRWLIAQSFVVDDKKHHPQQQHHHKDDNNSPRSTTATRPGIENPSFFH